ncbi:ATPase synthesis protein 25 mitochondrial [Savitreella phatthalungensis]
MLPRALSSGTLLKLRRGATCSCFAAYSRARTLSVASHRLQHTQSGTNPPPETTPWYVEYNQGSLQQDFAPKKRANAQVPEIPSDSPRILSPLLEYLSFDVGLTDVCVVDLRKGAGSDEANDPWGYGGAGVMSVLATAPRAERQLIRSIDAIKHFLKQDHRHSGLRVEGLQSLRDSRVRRRRRRKMQGRTNLARLEEEEQLRWLFVDCGCGEGDLDEARVVLQLFTPEGRAEFRLEDVYEGIANMYHSVVRPSETDSGPLAHSSLL